MKTSKILLIAAAALATSFFASDADAGFRSWMRRHAPRPVFVPAPRPIYVAPPVYVAPPAGVAQPVYVAPVHHHSYVRTSRQVWVAPVYSTTITGYDFFGNAIYGQVMTQAGYYRTVYTNTCGCGHSY